MKIISQLRLDQLSSEATASQRHRKNLNMHDDNADPCQRLFNALDPGSYIRPHRHLGPPKPECFVAVRGRMALVVFANDGRLEKIVPFGIGCDILAIELPSGFWHSLLALEPGSVFFETKPGPYLPLTDKDLAPWSPAEGTPEAITYLTQLKSEVARQCFC